MILSVRSFMKKGQHYVTGSVNLCEFLDCFIHRYFILTESRQSISLLSERRAKT